MKSATRTFVIAIVSAVFLLSLNGCASQTEIDQLRSELIMTQKKADAAAATAAAAKAEAEAARAEAKVARETATAASKAAGDVSRKADRMFERSLRK